MIESLLVGGLVAAAAGYLAYTFLARKKSACAKCALHQAVERAPRPGSRGTGGTGSGT